MPSNRTTVTTRTNPPPPRRAKKPAARSRTARTAQPATKTKTPKPAKRGKRPAPRAAAASRPRGRPRRSKMFSEEMLAQIDRVMQQRKTALDALTGLASDSTVTHAERVKASTMLLQATASYVNLDSLRHGMTPPPAAALAEPRPENPPA